MTSGGGRRLPRAGVETPASLAWDQRLCASYLALARLYAAAFRFAIRRSVPMLAGIGDTFVEHSKIAGAFSYLVSISTAPDPAFVIAL